MFPLCLTWQKGMQVISSIITTLILNLTNLHYVATSTHLALEKNIWARMLFMS
jgi:hypothetical protein